MRAAVIIVFIVVLAAGSLTLAKSLQITAVTDDRDTTVVTFEDAQYPPIGFPSSAQGIVGVELKLDDAGRVSGATALSGNFILVQAALENVRKWTFKPNAAKRAFVFYNYQIMEGRCNHHSSFLYCRGKISRPLSPVLTESQILLRPTRRTDAVNRTCRGHSRATGCAILADCGVLQRALPIDSGRWANL